MINISNYECDGQMSIQDFLEPLNVHKSILAPGQNIYKVIRGDVIRFTATDEKWEIESTNKYGYRVKDGYLYNVVTDYDVGKTVFYSKEDAERIAEQYLQTHEVIRATEINPVNTVAYSFYNKLLGRDSIAFYSELDNGMLYVKGFVTYEHLMLEKHKKKALKRFMEQDEFQRNDPKLIEYEPKFKNMYRINILRYDWDYAEADHCNAVG